MKRLTVIGLGLIGASCCAALKKRSIEWLISGYSRTKATRQHALAKGLIDKVSLDIITGSIVDFKKEMIGESFVINNPKASSSCGCGLSFSV